MLQRENRDARFAAKSLKRSASVAMVLGTTGSLFFRRASPFSQHGFVNHYSVADALVWIHGGAKIVKRTVI